MNHDGTVLAVCWFLRDISITVLASGLMWETLFFLAKSGHFHTAQFTKFKKNTFKIYQKNINRVSIQ